MVCIVIICDKMVLTALNEIHCRYSRYTTYTKNINGNNILEFNNITVQQDLHMYYIIYMLTMTRRNK